MQAALQSRRMRMVGQAKQLETDLESYNVNNNPGEPIQVSFNFEHDLADLKALEELNLNLDEPIAS